LAFTTYTVEADLTDLRLESAESHAKDNEAVREDPQITLSLCSMKSMLENQQDCAFRRLVVRTICIERGIDIEDIHPDLLPEGLSAQEDSVHPEHQCFITNTDKGRLGKLGLFNINVSIHPAKMITGCTGFIETFLFQGIQEDGPPNAGCFASSQVNSETLIRWMQICSQHETTSIMQPPHGFRLIDVER